MISPRTHWLSWHVWLLLIAVVIDAPLWVKVVIASFVVLDVLFLHRFGPRVGEAATCAGRAAVAHAPTPMVDGRCPVCGEEDTR